MSVLINGLQFPKDNAIAVVIHPDGTAYSSKMFAGVCTEYLTDCSAVPVPTPHGRLGDLDELKKIVASAKHMDAHIFNGKTMYSDHLCVGADYDDVCAAIDETPTIIPASGGEKDYE